jgi:hypothetical protein
VTANTRIFLISTIPFVELCAFRDSEIYFEAEANMPLAKNLVTIPANSNPIAKRTHLFFRHFSRYPDACANTSTR